MERKGETIRTTFAMDMQISPEIIKTIADITFKSASTLESGRKAAKEYRESLRLSKEHAHRLEMGMEGETNVDTNPNK